VQASCRNSWMIRVYFWVNDVDVVMFMRGMWPLKSLMVAGGGVLFLS
jgi:hypothetical protein